MIKTAIILAAGCGSRLRPHLDDELPKGALPLGNQSIIETSIQTLIECGINTIIIGTGHGDAYYNQLAMNYPQVLCIKNPIFDASGSMHTLSLLIPHVTSDALLLESDLIYEKRALTFAMDFPEDNLILATPFNNYGDEVFIDVDLNDQLKSMSKDRPHNLKNAHILSGITKCSLSLLNQMNAIYSDQNSAQVDYEDMLSSAAESTRIISIVNPDIHVMEIDTIDHLAIAKTILPEIKQHNLINHHERKYLLNPGPATISDRVKLAQVIPDICPREMEFNGVVSEIKGAIESMASSKAEDVTAVLFSGSGTASVESMISSTVHGHDHLLIVNQGAYGERMVQIAKVHQLPFTEYKPDPLIKLNLDELDKMIDQNGITHLALVHHETTTGLLNNLNDISVIIKKYNLTFCLDAMSSFGAVTIDMAKHHIHFCAASSNKNIQGTAGIGFVISDRAALNKIKTAPKRTVYLDLYNQYHYSHANHQFQFTPPVQTIYALREALRELIQEGIDKRYHRYQTLWKQLHSCMDRHGFSHLISPEDHGYLITAYLVPDDSSFSFNHFHDYLYRHHITVYPGKIGALNTFRMATIGSLRSVDMDLICEKISAYFKTHPLHSTT